MRKRDDYGLAVHICSNLGGCFAGFGIFVNFAINNLKYSLIMKRFLLIFGVLIAAIAFCVPASAWETPLMSGTIGKYKVKMKLNINEDTGKITGWYYYASKGSKAKITLSGSGEMFEEDGTVLIEKVNGKQTGKFVGMLWTGSLHNTYSYGYTGVWISPTGKRLDFEVEAMTH